MGGFLTGYVGANTAPVIIAALASACQRKINTGCRRLPAERNAKPPGMARGLGKLQIGGGRSAALLFELLARILHGVARVLGGLLGLVRPLVGPFLRLAGGVIDPVLDFVLRVCHGCASRSA